MNRWVFVLTPSHLLTRPAPNTHLPAQWYCACFTSVLCQDWCHFLHSLWAKSWKVQNTEIHSLKLLLFWQIVCVQWWDGPLEMSNVLLDFFLQWAVWESSYFVRKLRSCFLMSLFIADWWFLVFCVPLKPIHLFWAFSLLAGQRIHS